MPNMRAAAKWARASAKRRQQNSAVKTRIKTLFKKASAARSDGEAVRTAIAALDKAAARGTIHPNKAARKKSRLAKLKKG